MSSQGLALHLEIVGSIPTTATMKLYPHRQCCDADVTMTTTMQTRMRGNPEVEKRAAKIHHLRGEDRFWHWSDQEVISYPYHQ